MHKIMRLPEVIETTGLPRSTIYQKIAAKSFPLPISLGPKSVGWLAAHVDAWIEDRITQSFSTSK